MTGPIPPESVNKVSIPPEVFEAFNSMIQDNFNGNYASFMLKDVANKAAALLGKDRQYLYKHQLLDVEPAYREAGWRVVFDKPGYNESYEAYFKFTKKESK